jgi:uncharacterized membrane protein YcaP (DUF421 family)
MFFDSWSSLGHTALTGLAAYALLLLFLRISGKRTLAKMSAFDLVVTVALGSTLATVLLSKSVALAEGVLALALLILLQYAIAWSSVRSPRFQALIKAEPTLLLHQGRLLEGAMKAERITREEILAAVRASGTARLDAVAAVVLETDGTLSVVGGQAGDGAPDALDSVTRVSGDRAGPFASSTTPRRDR